MVEPPVVALHASSNGRVSGKPWKAHKDATVFVVTHYMFVLHNVHLQQEIANVRRIEDQKLGKENGTDTEGLGG